MKTSRGTTGSGGTAVLTRAAVATATIGIAMTATGDSKSANVSACEGDREILRLRGRAPEDGRGEGRPFSLRMTTCETLDFLRSRRMRRPNRRSESSQRGLPD